MYSNLETNACDRPSSVSPPLRKSCSRTVPSREHVATFVSPLSGWNFAQKMLRTWPVFTTQRRRA